MPINIAADQFDEYRLILLRAGSHAIWAEDRDGLMRLPKVSVLKRRRPTEQLQQVIEAKWGLCAFVLDFLPQCDNAPPCVVAEIFSSESLPDLIPVDLDDLPIKELNREERKVLQSILAGAERECGSFAHVGWIHEAMEWLSSELGHGAIFTERIRQFNAGRGFALIRFETLAGQHYWLKATGEPNAHEFHFTRQLAVLCPELLPPVLGMREEWNAWLMADAGEPQESLDLPMLELATRSMAELQKRTTGHIDRFLDLGACDQRLFILREHLSELMDYLRDVMAKQTSTKAIKLTERDFDWLESVLRDACTRMQELRIPDALIHNDLNPGNILFKGSHCVFTDWCEVGVGNPFFALQLLCLQAAGEGDWTSILRELYRQCWLDRLSTVQIEEALVLMPLLATLTHLYGRGTWLHSARRNGAFVESYARTLARYMYRAAQMPDLLEVLHR